MLHQHGRPDAPLAGPIHEDGALGRGDAHQDRIAVQALVALEKLQPVCPGSRQQLLGEAAGAEVRVFVELPARGSRLAACGRRGGLLGRWPASPGRSRRLPTWAAPRSRRSVLVRSVAASSARPVARLGLGERRLQRVCQLGEPLPSTLHLTGTTRRVARGSGRQRQPRLGEADTSSSWTEVHVYHRRSLRDQRGILESHSGGIATPVFVTGAALSLAESLYAEG